MIYGLRRMIYRATARYDIISVSSYAAGVYHTFLDIILKIYHPFRQGTDIIEKSTLLRAFFWHPRPESNRQLSLRRTSLYPFNYGG